MSNTKRRDNKGRVLQMGESQQDDGRYVYRYTTPTGKRKSVYSWSLAMATFISHVLVRENNLLSKNWTAFPNGSITWTF